MNYLSYPAGFVYIYSLFYSITNHGANVKLAQFLFIGLYLTFISVVFIIYNKTKKVRFFRKFLNEKISLNKSL